jgi:short-subunit dehydrogenase
MDIKGKVVLITGASSGIGKVTAELLAKKGAKVALAARSVDKLKAMAATMTDSLVVPADMTKQREVRQMVKETYKHYGRLDVLINNAGRGMLVPIELTDLKDFADIISLNVYGPLLAMQAVIPIMRKQGGGTIINVSSMVTKNVYPILGAYASTKSALNMLSLTARKELANDKIIVSLVHPKLTATNFARNAVKSKVEFEAPSRQMPEADPPEKVAECVIKIIQTGEEEIEVQ